MEADTEHLTPATSEEVIQVLCFALRFQGRKQVQHASEIATRIAAERLVEYPECSRYVVTKRPPEPPQRPLLSEDCALVARELGKPPSADLVQRASVAPAVPISHSGPGLRPTRFEWSHGGAQKVRSACPAITSRRSQRWPAPG